MVCCGNSKQDPGGSAGNSGAGTSPGGAGVRAEGGSGGASGSAGSGTVKVEVGGEGNECRREVSLQAVVLGAPPPFDLVIVADHSGSLAWSKDELTAGLRSLLTNVKGRAVRVFLLTPTQYGASSAAARYPLSERAVVAWKDPVTGVAYQDAVTDYVQTCTDPAGNVITCPEPSAITEYKLHGEWRFVMPEPVAVLTPALTDAEFAAEQAAVADAILAIGGTGSPNEQPLCTLSRYLSQPAAKLPENVVLLVISDEDDVSKPDDCLLTFDADVHRTPMTQTNVTPCSSNCEAYSYQLSGTLEQPEHAFTCAAFSDTGSMVPGSEQMQRFASAGGCNGVTSGACSEQDKATAQSYCPMGLKLTACTTSCATRPTTCFIELNEELATPCASPFTYGGASYKDLPDYCSGMGTDWHDCEVHGSNREVVTTMGWAPASAHMNVMPGSTTADVARYITSKRAMAFPAGKSLLEGIVLDPSFTCTLGAGQSYATNLETVIADPKHVFPLCQSYAPALDGVAEFAQTLLQTEYTITLKDDEHVTSVVVVGKDGGERTLAKSDYTFDEKTGSLSIGKSALRGTDANLRVEVTSDCRPIVK